jgi:hypothetical protein
MLEHPVFSAQRRPAVNLILGPMMDFVPGRGMRVVIAFDDQVAKVPRRLRWSRCRAFSAVIPLVLEPRRAPAFIMRGTSAQCTTPIAPLRSHGACDPIIEYPTGLAVLKIPSRT